MDPADDRPTVAAQQADPDSLLHQVRTLIRLRRAHPELGTGGTVQVLSDGYPFVYTRGEKYLVIVNPAARTAEFKLGDAGVALGSALVTRGVAEGEGGVLNAEPFSYAVYRLGDPYKPT